MSLIFVHFIQVNTGLGCVFFLSRSSWWNCHKSLVVCTCNPSWPDPQRSVTWLRNAFFNFNCCNKDVKVCGYASTQDYCCMELLRLFFIVVQVNLSCIVDVLKMKKAGWCGRVKCSSRSKLESSVGPKKHQIVLLKLSVFRQWLLQRQCVQCAMTRKGLELRLSQIKLKRFKLQTYCQWSINFCPMCNVNVNVNVQFAICHMQWQDQGLELRQSQIKSKRLQLLIYGPKGHEDPIAKDIWPALRTRPQIQIPI